MALAILKYASNKEDFDLQGRIGELNLLDDGTFSFEYIDDGRKVTLCLPVMGHLGEPNDVRSKEVNIQAERSYYDFEKLENYIEEANVFDDTTREALCVGLDEVISNARGVAMKKDECRAQSEGKNLTMSDFEL